MAGVEVKNEGEGQVVVDDVSVEKGQSTTTTGSAGTEPEPEPESKPESDRDEEEEFGKVEVGGTDSDLSLIHIWPARRWASPFFVICALMRFLVSDAMEFRLFHRFG